MPHTRESALWARAGGAAAHLQSKMRSIAGSFLSSGMLIGDEEAASHWALSRLGVSMCPGMLANGTAVPLVGSHCAAELVRLIVTLMPSALLLPHAGPASSEHHAIACQTVGARQAGRQIA